MYVSIPLRQAINAQRQLELVFLPSCFDPFKAGYQPSIAHVLPSFFACFDPFKAGYQPNTHDREDQVQARFDPFKAGYQPISMLLPGVTR